jgi:hypothetical protein
MQEQFVLKAKTAIKRVAAMSTGALMLGATALGGVAAIDLGDYPAPFVADGVWGGLVVVGSGANAADIVGATDIIGRLTQEAVSPVSGTGTTTVTGGTSGKVLLGGGAFNSTYTDTIDTELEDDDISALIDTEITFNENDYNVRDMLKFSVNGIIPHTSFTANDKEYGENVYLEVADAAMCYYYLFDTSINVTEASTTTPLDLNFMGRALSITSVTAAGTGFTAYVGDEYTMSVGDMATIEGKLVKLENVGSGTTASTKSVLVSVDGVQKTVSGTTPLKIGPVGAQLEVRVDDTFYSDTTAERMATLIIGEEAQESYTNNARYVKYCADGYSHPNCKKTDPDWRWVIQELNASAASPASPSATATSGPVIGVCNDYVVNGDEDNPATIGGFYDFPEGNFKVEFDSLSTDSYMDLTMALDDSLDVSGLAGHGTGANSIDAIKITSGEADSIELGSSYGNTKTEMVWITLNDTDADIINVYYNDNDDNVAYGGALNTNDSTAVVGAIADIEIAQINFAGTKSSNMGIDITSPDNISVAATFLNVTFDVVDDDNKFTEIGITDNIITQWKHDATLLGGFTMLGSTTANEAGETYANVVTTSTDISTKDESVYMTAYGIKIYDPKGTGGNNEVKLAIPSDQVRANIVISGTGTTTTSAGGSVQINSIAGVDLVKLDTEVTDKTSKPMIIVGGPAINPLAAEALGLTYPAYGAASGIPEGKALIQLVENAFGGENVALVVAGWEAANTREATTILKNFDSYTAQLTGKMKVQVSGTSVTAVTEAAAVDAADDTTDDTTA